MHYDAYPVWSYATQLVEHGTPPDSCRGTSTKKSENVCTHYCKLLWIIMSAQ